MDILNYKIEKEIFENNLGAFFAATKTGGEKCVVLKVNKTFKNEEFLAKVAAFAAKEKPSVSNVLFMKSLKKDGDEYYAEYEYFDGKPVSFIMSRSRKSAAVKKMFSDIAAGLDGLDAAGIVYGGLNPESAIAVGNDYYIVGAEFYNTDCKLFDNSDLYSPGYTDPELLAGNYSSKCNVYSMGRFVASVFLAEKLYTNGDYPIPDIPQLQPVQKAIDKAVKTEEKYASCKEFTDSIPDFKGTCPFTDHGSQYATYAYIAVVIILVIVDLVFNLHGKALGG